MGAQGRFAQGAVFYKFVNQEDQIDVATSLQK